MLRHATVTFIGQIPFSTHKLKKKSLTCLIMLDDKAHSDFCMVQSKLVKLKERAYYLHNYDTIKTLNKIRKSWEYSFQHECVNACNTMSEKKKTKDKEKLLVRRSLLFVLGRMSGRTWVVPHLRRGRYSLFCGWFWVIFCLSSSVHRLAV